MYRAVLDTCVLVPSLQRDFVLQLAAESAYAPHWSSGTLDELRDELGRIDQRRSHPTRDADYARLTGRMQEVFPGATVEAPRHRSYLYRLHDRGDEHVLHAALMAGADVIVTDDTRAGLSSSSIVREANIEVLRTADFLANTVAAHRDKAVAAILELYRRRSRPRYENPRGLLEDLCRRGDLGEVSALLREEVDFLSD